MGCLLRTGSEQLSDSTLPGISFPVMLRASMSPVLTPPGPAERGCADDPAAVISHAAFFSRNSSMDAESLFQCVDSFLDLLTAREVPSVLAGGLALLVHAEGRNTKNLDLIVAFSDILELPGLALEERNEWFARGSFGPLRVDFLFTANPLFSDVAGYRSETNTFRRHRLRVASAEGLLQLKLFALPSLYRQGQTARAALYEADIALLLLTCSVSDDELLNVLRPHMIDSDISALADVLRDIRVRLKRKF
jgi:hypothetical protein